MPIAIFYSSLRLTQKLGNPHTSRLGKFMDGELRIRKAHALHAARGRNAWKAAITAHGLLTLTAPEIYDT